MQVINAGGVIYNAPIVAFGVGASDIDFPNGSVDYSKVHDEVAAIDPNNMTVTRLAVFRFLGVSFATLVRLFCSQKSLLLENLAFRQQLSVLKRRHPRPRLDLSDRLFWLIVRRCRSGWKQALLVATPETVVRWHRAGFRWYWRVISKVRKPLGRRPLPQDVRDLIFQMVAENPT